MNAHGVAFTYASESATHPAEKDRTLARMGARQTRPGHEGDCLDALVVTRGVHARGGALHETSRYSRFRARWSVKRFGETRYARWWGLCDLQVTLGYERPTRAMVLLLTCGVVHASRFSARALD